MFTYSSICELERILKKRGRDYEYARALNNAAREAHIDVTESPIGKEILRDYVLPLMRKAKERIAQSSEKSKRLFLDAMRMRVYNLELVIS